MAAYFRAKAQTLGGKGVMIRRVETVGPDGQRNVEESVTPVGEDGDK